jgi:hypothetical protein
MTAVTATDESGGIEYNFKCVAGETGCGDSGWQGSPFYTASGLQADTYYAFEVSARDAAGNTNSSSAMEGATTHAFEPPNPDNQPPSPAQMTWQTPPQATGASTISMTAITATDESGVVEYHFKCVVGATGCGGSGWQSSPSYTATGLQPDSYYAFKVSARDAASNTNNKSAMEGATTHADEPPHPDNQPPAAVAVYSPDPPIISKGNSVQVEFDGTGSSDPDGTIAAWSWEDSDGSIVSTQSVFSVSMRAGTYSYTLTVTYDDGANGSTEVTLEISNGNSGASSGGKDKKVKG